MEMVASSSAPPFHNRDVSEWSRLDSITGVLQSARFETDHWVASTPTATATYNKAVDSRSQSQADGGVQRAARRQCEVFRSQTPGGRMQVIKTHTVASSRWSSSRQAPFADLQLPLNPLDLASAKAKASVGRRGARRPPTRAKVGDHPLHTTANANLHRVSRLCHQIHSCAVQETFGRAANLSRSSEELFEKVDDDWLRSSKLRRSLQDRRLSTALRGNSAIDLNALDAILLSISNSSLSSDSDAANLIVARKPQRESFVSAETIQAVREKLRSSKEPSFEQIRADSSSDSGICRSTLDLDDNAVGNVKRYAMLFESRIEEQARTSEPKRHSIAVDELKYISDAATKPRSSKKVEFCKTEVHFAADSGRVKIVETDDKPPPTQRFRRRRRHSGSEDAVPASHFGDVTVNGAADGANFYEIEEQPHADPVRGILKNKASSPPVDERTSPWSVAERIKQVEELKWIESKGYSTKVNVGNGATTVVENRSKAPMNKTTTKIRIDLTDVHSDSEADKEVDRILKSSGSPPLESESKADRYQQISDQIEKDLKYLNEAVKNLNLKAHPLHHYHSQLSSPLLVGAQSRSDSEQHREASPKRFTMQQSVLRQPKQSEMTYFGVQLAGDRPDLLQFHNSPIYQNIDVEKETRSKLDTITENRSWQQPAKPAARKKDTHSYAAKTTSTELKTRKKAAQQSDTTRARRLQRASSREALLQSHGSSSEDLPHHVEAARRPRSVKRTKTAAFSATSGIIDLNKGKSVGSRKLKAERSMTSTGLPEIRHRTVVSTIRSTAEKQRDAKRKTTHAANGTGCRRAAAAGRANSGDSGKKTGSVAARPIPMSHRKSMTRAE